MIHKIIRKTENERKINLKKTLSIILLVFLTFVFAACNNGNDTVNEGDNNTTEAIASHTQPTVEENKVNYNDNSHILFLTEYEVEDYIENALIVSKNNQLLYGLLDGNGEEVIPVKYDKMKFMNKEDYINGTCDAYIWAKYESTEYVFDTNGNIIAESENNIEYIDYAIKPDVTDNVAIFSEKTDETIYLYNSNYANLYTLQNYLLIEYINKNTCLITDLSFTFSGAGTQTSYTSDINGTFLLNLTDNTTQNFGTFNSVKTFPSDDICYAVLDSKVLLIDEEGKIIEEKDFNSNTESFAFANEQSSVSVPYNLYESNSTWKMENLNGNPLYAERYYSRYKFYEGENDCIFLMDENNSLCAFGKQGNLYAEFGKINVSGNDFYILTEEGEKRIGKIHEGKESMVVITKSSSNSTIHFFEKINL